MFDPSIILPAILFYIHLDEFIEIDYSISKLISIAFRFIQF